MNATMRMCKAMGTAAVAAAALLGGTSALAQYYMGPSFVKIEGLNGGAKEKEHRNWLRAEADYWTARPAVREIRGISGRYNGMKFTVSRASTRGPSMLAISVDKKSPGLAAMMDKCHSGQKLPEVTFAEDAELTRHPQEHGPRPADVPAFYEYRLKGVTLTCPVVADAPEQAFALKFEQIEWLNAKPSPKPIEVMAEPAKLRPVAQTGETRTFLISWFATVGETNNKACPKMNTKPTQDDYYALMTPERAAAQKAKLASQGGANTMVLPYRGPDEMVVTMLPGIVKDPGFYEPQTDVVRGLNLDNNDGTGKAPAGIRAHKNFTAPWGEKGIDNQLYTVSGCIEGWKRNGFLPLIGNELRHAGGLAILMEVSGIDNMQNDNDVAVTIYYSADPTRRDGTSKIVLPDYTFRVNDSTEFSQDYARFKGKIVNGVITTNALDAVYMHEGPATTWPLYKARLRLEITPDGNLKGLLGGYRDWREWLGMAFFRQSDYENTIGFTAPGMYNAARRAADGLKDPVTGDYNGLSAAYDLEGVPAFIPPDQDKKLLAGMDIREKGSANKAAGDKAADKTAETKTPAQVIAAK